VWCETNSGSTTVSKVLLNFTSNKGMKKTEMLSLLSINLEDFLMIAKRYDEYNIPVKLGIWTEMLGPKSCEALASTCGLRRSLARCLEFWRSGRSRRVRNRAEKMLKKTRAS